jgi:hypothetical protein
MKDKDDDIDVGLMQTVFSTYQNDYTIPASLIEYYNQRCPGSPIIIGEPNAFLTGQHRSRYGVLDSNTSRSSHSKSEDSSGSSFSDLSSSPSPKSPSPKSPSPKSPSPRPSPSSDDEDLEVTSICYKGNIQEDCDEELDPTDIVDPILDQPLSKKELATTVYNKSYTYLRNDSAFYQNGKLRKKPQPWCPLIWVDPGNPYMIHEVYLDDDKPDDPDYTPEYPLVAYYNSTLEQYIFKPKKT